MANKYIIQGATYNGDGTASNEAASAGAAGAWNHIDIISGTAVGFGSLAAGDKVFIRSKTSAGADIALTSATAVTIGVVAATEASPIVWVIDAGDVWSGISGTITYTFTAQVAVTLRDYNHWIADNYNFQLINTLTSFGNTTFAIIGKCATKDLKIDCSAHTSGLGAWNSVLSGTHVNMWLRSWNRYQYLFKVATASQSVTIIDPKIELLNSANTASVFAGTDNYNGSFNVFGGEVYGAGAADNVPLCMAQPNACGISIYGLKYPRNMPLSNSTALGSQVCFIANGSDGALGNSYFDYFCAYDSRDDGYYPVLNAFLETSTADGWSYKLYPYRTTYQNPATIHTSKIYTASAAAKTVTLNLLWPTTMAAPTADKVFITVQYIDNATGNKVTQTTRAMAGGALSASAAAWSATTYGASSFDKKELSLTTSGSIKQDTEVLVSLFVIPKSASVNDIIFVDPDPVFS